MKTRILGTWSFAATLLIAAPAITVEDIVRLAKAGVSDQIIQSQIRAKGEAFDLTAGELVALKSAGVTDQTIRMMMRPGAVRAGAATPQPVVLEKTAQLK